MNRMHRRRFARLRMRKVVMLRKAEQFVNAMNLMCYGGMQ